MITAANIIKNEVRARECNSESYPTTVDIESSRWVPDHLPTLLKAVVPVIALSLFGLGVEMDHVFGSKWLINELLRLGAI